MGDYTSHLGGWLNPKRCVETLINHPLIQVQTYHRITSVESTVSGPKLQITISGDQTIYYSCDLLIWANAREASQFTQLPLSFKAVRGQITEIKMRTAIKMPICGDAYLAPAWDGA